VPLETNAEKLADARAKHHLLLTGTQRVAVRDGDTTVEYNPGNKSDLKSYINELETLVAQESGGSAASRPSRAPAGIIW
jgi:hypothetical protein